MPKIVIEKGAGRGDAFRIAPGETLVVGRSLRADILLADTLVSRTHVHIEGRTDGYYLRDAHSLNGVFLNGERVLEARIGPGDRIQLGDCLLSFLGDDERRTSGGLIGQEIAGHRIIERVGRGGMGTVYKAIQLSLDRVVAIKFLAPELVRDPLFVARFISEAQAAGYLNHPNIVQVFDTGRSEDLCYYTMEFMPFGSLGDQIVGGQKLQPANALPMMIDVARGLLYAEKKGLVHRDIKPDNLMIGFDGVTKIGDMGIAVMIRGRTAAQQAEGVYGSAHFMAPEQALGRDIDCRADLYGMGATFYRVLTGRTLFPGKSPREILLKQINEAPTPIRDVEPDLPPALAGIIDRMVRKKPDERFRSVSDFLGTLEDLARSLSARNR